MPCLDMTSCLVIPRSTKSRGGELRLVVVAPVLGSHVQERLLAYRPVRVDPFFRNAYRYGKRCGEGPLAVPSVDELDRPLSRFRAVSPQNETAPPEFGLFLIKFLGKAKFWGPISAAPLALRCVRRLFPLALYYEMFRKQGRNIGNTNGKHARAVTSFTLNSKEVEHAKSTIRRDVRERGFGRAGAGESDGAPLSPGLAARHARDRPPASIHASTLTRRLSTRSCAKVRSEFPRDAPSPPSWIAAAAGTTGRTS